MLQNKILFIAFLFNLPMKLKNNFFFIILTIKYFYDILILNLNITPLKQAVENGNTEIIKLFLERKELDINRESILALFRLIEFLIIHFIMF